ncbi:PH domain-containing protein [uncultured Corynebacterium sp.]|uniref:PH domain-containing protein n=1 Tax=uncultured Corynebacterium sp. TaxID=159447 RepID=UPI0025DEF8B3|nr:PH domain-containing protein [uncultured Corynebacterium sp.]
MSSTPSGEHTPGSHPSPHHAQPAQGAGHQASRPAASSLRTQKEKIKKTTTIRPDRMNLIGAIVMFLIFLIFVGYKPAYLFWVLVFPILFAVWVLRARTEISPTGITARYLFRSSRTLSWDDFSGVQFSRGGRAYAVPNKPNQGTNDQVAERGRTRRPRKKRDTVALPGVTFNNLPELAKASGGLIPDPVTPGRNRDDDELTTVNRDGYAVVKTREEATKEHNAKLIAAEMERRRAAQHPTSDETSETSHRNQSDAPEKPDPD